MRDQEAVWRVCRCITGDCNNCSPIEILDGEKWVRGCYAHATEVLNIVETGNPWRKATGVKPPWVVL